MPKLLILITLFVLSILALAGCTSPSTQADAQATAQVAGCWPGNVATPRAVTVTPDLRFVSPTSRATATRDPAMPTATHLPTTTPYPRCTPGPGETLTPYPTPVPAPPPYPTHDPRLRQGGSDRQTIMQLPGHTYGLKLAVHPTEGWPVVGITQRFSESADPIQSFVRVFNPTTRTWGAAQQLDIGPASNGQDRFGSTVVGITGDRAVHAVWGASDAEGADGDQPARLWTSTSADYGASWSPPRAIAADCWVADDMATTAGGWIVVLANCYAPRGDGEATPQATLIVRRPDGAWHAPDRLDIPGWYGAEGAVVIVGDGDDARAIALRFGSLGASNGTLYLVSKRLADPGAWQVQQREITIPYGNTGERPYHAAGLVFPQMHADGSVTNGVIFTWTGAATTGAYALVSLDGGRRWGAIEPIVYDGRDPRAAGPAVQWIAPAYDVAANRLMTIWTCCEPAEFDARESTHYASWSVPGSGLWHPSRLPGQIEPLLPIVLGSRSAWTTATAQSPNSRSVWIAWVEQGNQVQVRTLNLNQLLPMTAYPTPSPRPSPTRAPGGMP